MTNPIPANGVPTSQPNPSGGRSRHLLRTSAILLVALLLLAGGGWWANQAGLLPAAATASSVAAGVQAQPDQLAGAQTSQIVSETVQASGALTATFPGEPGLPAGFPPSPNGQTRGQAPGSALAVGSDTAAGETSATAIPATAATTATDLSAPANLVTIPAVAGVKGSRLVDDSGVLLATLESGDIVLLTGRSDDSAWLTVTAQAGAGWVQAKELIAYGLQRLPQVALPEAVAPAALLAPTGAETSAAAVPVTVADTVAESDAETPAHPLTLSSAQTTATIVTDEGRLNLRAGPSTDYAVIGKGENGNVYMVLGRNAAGDWLQLQLDGGEVGWASAGYLEVGGDVEALPLQLAPAPAAQANVTEPAANVAAGSALAGAEGAVTLVSNVATATGATGSASAANGLAGTLVFQQSPGGMIYAYNLATGDLWPLTNGFDPAISPDGSTVAFVRDGGETGLYLIDIDGGNERRIFERANLSSPKWSTDGQWIVFTRNDEGVECYKVSDRMCLLSDEFNKRFPMGAPSEIPLVTEYQYKLSAVDRNGDNYHDVSSLNSARAADWSDAGIVYQSSAGIQITADAEGATTQEVAFDNLNPFYFDPDLQPGGGQVVFQKKGAAQTDLWVVNTDGSGLAALTRPKTTLVDTLPSNVAAAYSPDGQHIVFLSNRTGSGEAGDWHLWVMNADGSDQRQLPVDLAIEYTYGDDQVVSWGA